jgi:hypothetical protein
VQVAGDRRQRRRDDRLIERRQQHPQQQGADDDEHPPLTDALRRPVAGHFGSGSGGHRTLTSPSAEGRKFH